MHELLLSGFSCRGALVHMLHWLEAPGRLAAVWAMWIFPGPGLVHVSPHWQVDSSAKATRKPSTALFMAVIYSFHGAAFV